MKKPSDRFLQPGDRAKKSPDLPLEPGDRLKNPEDRTMDPGDHPKNPSDHPNSRGTAQKTQGTTTRTHGSTPKVRGPNHGRLYQMASYVVFLQEDGPPLADCPSGGGRPASREASAPGLYEVVRGLTPTGSPIPVAGEAGTKESPALPTHFQQLIIRPQKALGIFHRHGYWNIPNAGYHLKRPTR